MSLENPWIGYVTRSYQQIKDAVLTEFQSLVPEMTDHTEANPYVKMISIWAGITEMLGYYLDNKARELYLSTMRRFENAAKLAESYDYRIKGTVAATVDVKFFFNTPAPSDVLIPQGTEIKTNNDIIFFTLADATILTGETDVTVAAINQTVETGVSLGVSDGTGNQKFPLVSNVVDNSVIVTAAGTDVYSPVDTFAFSIGTDQVFVGGLNTDKVMEIKFGDDINGKIPLTGQALVVSYSTSSGADGNVGAGGINEVVTSVTVPSGFTLQVTNILAASGGTNQEDLEELQENMPKSLRTLMRAVTEQDYQDLAELVSGVAKAGVEFDCGKVIDIYVAPVGGGIASSALLTAVEDYLDDKKMVTTFVNAQAAGEVILKLAIDVNIFNNYDSGSVETAVTSALTSFLSISNQSIRGSVVLGDLYEQVETTEGVKNSNITSIKPVPHARPLNHDTALDWVRSVGDIETTTEWTVVAVSGTIYELFRGSVALGNFTFGTEYLQDELTFTINASGTYTPGNRWQFITYPVDRNISLEEPSILVSNDVDITLNIIGGQ